MSPARRPRTDRWGVDDGYQDVHGIWRETSPATRSAILASMRRGEADAAPVEDPPVRVIVPGQTLSVDRPAELVLEDGTVLPLARHSPPDLPLGYHRVRTLEDGRETFLIVSPGRCHLVEGARQWGWAVQLYAARSNASWGMGDLADLRRLGRWSATEVGADLLLVNPLFASVPLPPIQPSPYFPSSRCYRDPLYLHIEEIPGAVDLEPELEPLAAAGRALNLEPTVDRDAIFRLKMDALERLWGRFGGHPDFDAYCAEEGDALVRFATFCALAEHHRTGWRQWPAEHRHPQGPEVARFRDGRADRVRFHQWVQWLLGQQLDAAVRELRVVHDLPIGVDPDGADAWAWQDLLAPDVTVGAPPDAYHKHGQDWGLPPLVPYRLREAGYAPFARIVRASLRHGGGLRIDHVMGLFRLFWIPGGRPPVEGAYVRYHADELLAVLALESERAQAIVVGEDLGTVEEGVREELARCRVLSYRLLWFEPGEPASYPALSLAAITNHDLPSIAGLWSGSDLATQQALGLSPNVEGFEEMRRHLARLTGLGPDAPLSDVILRAHERLAEAPSAVVVATLEDALAVEERTNFPGTTGETHPNWSRALPLPLEALEVDSQVRALGETLRAAGR